MSCRIDKGTIGLTPLINFLVLQTGKLVFEIGHVTGRLPYPVIPNLDRPGSQARQYQSYHNQEAPDKKLHQSLKRPDSAGIDDRETYQPSQGLAGSQKVPLARCLQTFCMKVVRLAT
jgi:hypothetical protein